MAILPFSHGEGDDGVLAAGLAGDLEISLAEMSGIKTVSRAQSLAIAGTHLSPVETAWALDARYLVGGSVQQSGEDLAVSVRLIDGADGTTLWADRYEGPRSGAMGFLHAVPEELLGAMSIALSDRDQSRLAITNTSDPEAFEEVMRARLAISAFAYEDSLAAEKHLRRAIELDPGYAHAHAELAAVLAIRFENGWVILSTADTEKALYFAEKALELDPELWLAHYAMGRIHSVIPTGDLDAALRHLRVAMSLQPANDDARVYYAVVTTMSGRPEEALPILESVIQAHPRAPFWYHLALGHTLFHLRRYDEAEPVLKTCLEQMPNSPLCLRSLIATYSRLGRSEDAEWMLEEYAILGHDTSLDALMNGAIERDTALRAHLSGSYRQLGLD